MVKRIILDALCVLILSLGNVKVLSLMYKLLRPRLVESSLSGDLELTPAMIDVGAN